MIKKSEIVRKLEGIDRRAVELVAGAGAAMRHLARVDTTVAVARAAAAEQLGQGESGSAKERLLMWALLTLDLNGLGGHADAGLLGGQSGATIRRPEFKKLGKGRWLASDGGAWRAAAEGAVEKIAEWFGENRPQMVPRGSQIFVRSQIGARYDPIEVEVPVPNDDWTEAYARGQLLRLGQISEEAQCDENWQREVEEWSVVAFPPVNEEEATQAGRAWAERRAYGCLDRQPWSPTAVEAACDCPAPKAIWAESWSEICCQSATTRWEELVAEGKIP